MNAFPPPTSLIKATKMEWASGLRDAGIIRLSSINYYRQIENGEIGDKNEGIAEFKLHGLPMTTSSINEVFIWCAALPETPPEILKELDTDYNVILRIHNVAELTKRIMQAAKKGKYVLVPQLGRINYNKGEEVSKKVLNDQKWQHNIFQKSSNYSHQQEYRLAFSNMDPFKKVWKQYLELSLGPCDDIISIE